MERWITSDLHLGHKNIAIYCDRPFCENRGDEVAVDVDAMNAWIVEMLNATTRPGDLLLIVGDAGLGKILETLPLFRKVHARLELIVGNHDRCAPYLPKYKPEWLTTYRETGGFQAIYTEPQRVDYGRGHSKVLTWHFPYQGDSQGKDRYAEVRIPDTGELLVHGHVHDEWRQRGRQVNVGLDAWGGRLLSFDEVAGLLDAAPQNLDRIPWPKSVTLEGAAA